MQTGRTEEAEREFALAIELHRSSGDRRLQGVTRGNLGELLRQTGQPKRAEAEFAAALAIIARRATGDPKGSRWETSPSS
jgi:tetratricopeptide (TPR) repeat protein